jgi:hypothetical protein
MDRGLVGSFSDHGCILSRVLVSSMRSDHRNQWRGKRDMQRGGSFARCDDVLGVQVSFIETNSIFVDAAIFQE